MFREKKLNLTLFRLEFFVAEPPSKNFVIETTQKLEILKNKHYSCGPSYVQKQPSEVFLEISQNSQETSVPETLFKFFIVNKITRS